MALVLVAVEAFPHSAFKMYNGSMVTKRPEEGGEWRALMDCFGWEEDCCGDVAEC